MSEEKKVTIKATKKKAVALKTLCTSKGLVRKGEEFTCTPKEYEYFKSAKAI